MERDLQTQVLALDFQASKAHLEVHQWKRRAAMLQLKLDSQCEDGLCAQQYSNILSREVHRQQHAVKAAERQCQLLKVAIDICANNTEASNHSTCKQSCACWLKKMGMPQTLRPRSFDKANSRNKMLLHVTSDVSISLPSISIR